MSVKLLTEHHLEFLSLKEGCTGSSESTLVKMPHCWQSHVTAQLCQAIGTNQFSCISGAGNDNNHARPDTSMKLGRNVHWHELLEFFSLAKQNWSIFKMAALKSKMAATINVKS